jgi:glycosyltransferase involved in cell wall biosynthesis
MKKHICMIAYTYYLSDARVRREAETLASMAEYDVTVLALKGMNAGPGSYSKDGVKVRELNADKYRGKSGLRYLLSYVRFTLLALAACAGLLTKKSVDIVHIHNMPNFLIFSALGPLILGKKIILDIHDTTIETYDAKFKRKSNKLLFYVLRCEELLCCALAHRIICVNEIQREVLVRRGIPSGKIVVSMNVPDPRIFHADKANATTKKENGFRLVYFGTVTRRLGMDLAIRAVASFSRDIPGLEFHVIGGGDDLREFSDLSKELGVDQTIHFYERAFPLEDLVRVLGGMDLGLVPNRRNAATELMLPVKMLECVALGIPVVAPRLRTIEHYFSEESVFYFEPDDVDSLSKAILEASADEVLRGQKAENARKFLQTYDWETHKLELLSLYKSFAR